MTHPKQVSARGLLILFVSALCATTDQVSKTWALTNLTRGQPQPFIPGLINLNLTTNPGAAFSLGSQNGQVMGLVATVLSLVILAWVVKRVLSTAPLPVVEQIGMGCLLGGAAGNLIDRYTRGMVTDFFDFAFMDFPIFNAADALIDVGIFCLFITMYVYRNTAAENSLSHRSSVSAPAEATTDSASDSPSQPETSTQNPSAKHSD